MSHTYNYSCENCDEKFCQCHPTIHVSTICKFTSHKTNFDYTFCNYNCFTNWLDEKTSYEKITDIYINYDNKLEEKRLKLFIGL